MSQPLRLFLVCDDLVMGDNSDLFCRAPDPASAVNMWRTYFEIEEGTQPERVIECPPTEGPRGPVDWDSIGQPIRPPS